ncbi:Ribonuclease 3 [Colletotrichum orbiculare MAFF 240422]|uniref:Ribonuclease 3 n=1 Tax=Colletotrichum orbiculare (strain 104-T / ATCC 96160 / CBS 514.97 / LARS 414 / MAFF 240422) TaxID=1213857 RepID=N4VB95_COLOR|nr:Ribonuclease 3 [Colletotrichum orbiculare MAFF 240422]
MSNVREERLAAIHAIHGHNFENPDLIWEALQAHGSPIGRIGIRFLNQGNKGVALTGDAVIRLVVVNNGVGNNERTEAIANRIEALLSNSTLAAICDTVGLTGHIVGNPSQGGAVSSRLKATTVEAVIGAVFMDAGFEAARASMERMGII